MHENSNMTQTHCVCSAVFNQRLGIPKSTMKLINLWGCVHVSSYYLCAFHLLVDPSHGGACEQIFLHIYDRTLEDITLFW